jgi:16S rRNA (uracil1498-N3)-methyltransferase
MVRIFIKREWISGNEVLLIKGEAHYVLNVLRMKKGDELFLFDPDGNEYRGKIIRRGHKEVHISIVDRMHIDRESRREIVLIQSILKGEKMDLIVQKGSELGVKRIYPVISERTIPDYNRENSVRRRERWQKIALEACEQCGRNRVTVIEEILPFREAIERVKTSFRIRILLFEFAREFGLKDFLRKYSNDSECGVAIMVGPEGGFTKDEIEISIKMGFVPVSLGKRILRAETASIVALGIIQYELGDLGSP